MSCVRKKKNTKLRLRYGKEVKVTYLELRNENNKLSRHRKKNNGQMRNSRETATV
jgi:hypothetical protein